MPIRGRLASLDALRAIAAAIVLIHHAGPRLFGAMLLPRGYLAVDFFFMLSGFVMAHAYDDRLRDGLGGAAMLRARIARLYPTIALGIVAAAAVKLTQGVDPGQIAVLLATSLLFVPILASPEAGIFLLDGVQWSLLFELLANGAHTRIHGLSNRALAFLTALAALASVAASSIYGSLGIGDVGGSFAGGPARVAFPYLAGMLLHRAYRAGLLSGGRIAAPLCAVALSALLMLPATRLWWGDAAVVILAFPVLLAGAVGARTGGAFLRLSEVGGRLSYPLYALHLPAISATAALWGGAGLAEGVPALVAGCTVSLLLSVGAHALLRRGPWRSAAIRSQARRSLRFGRRMIHRTAGALR